MNEKRFVKPLNNNEIFEYMTYLYAKNEILKEENEELRKAEKINMEYAEQIVEENHKFLIAKNDLRIENERLQKENEQLQAKIEMGKNDFFISEAKRMTLLAFIEDKELQKEYFEWERRIYDEREADIR